MYPPPPIPFIHGSTTPAVKAVVTAASTAFPPRRRTSAPAAAACGVLAATIPPRPRASSRLTCHSVSTGITRPSPDLARLSPTDHRRPMLQIGLRTRIEKWVLTTGHGGCTFTTSQTHSGAIPEADGQQTP